VGVVLCCRDSLLGNAAVLSWICTGARARTRAGAGLSRLLLYLFARWLQLCASQWPFSNRFVCRQLMTVQPSFIVVGR
jgi:hypothetical protein